MRKIDLIIIHCSATKANRNFTVEDLEACHKARGFKTIGYHYYITKDGEIYPCRPERKQFRRSKKMVETSELSHLNVHLLSQFVSQMTYGLGIYLFSIKSKPCSR